PVVVVESVDAEGTVLASAYRGVLDIDPPESVGVPPGAASTVFSGHPVFRRLRGQNDPLVALRQDLTRPVVRGVGGGTVRAVAQGPEVRPSGRPWELRTVQTLSLEDTGTGVDAALRLVGASEGSPGRVKGTVTNRGLRPIRQLRAQIYEGQARLPALLGPGETVEVDAPIIAPTSQGPGRLTATAEEVAMFSTASRSFTAPGQVAVVGLVSGPTAGARKAKGQHVSVIVAVSPIISADTVLTGTGGSRLVSSSGQRFGGPPTGQAVRVFDLDAPAGAGPLSIRYDPLRNRPNFRTFPYSIQAYSWATGTWRTLPSTVSEGGLYLDTPLDPAEVKTGLVRIRTQLIDPRSSGTVAQLLLTSESVATEERYRAAVTSESVATEERFRAAGLLRPQRPPP
ncbi:MAG: hypothetical protein WKF86_05755, partial [Acidimicrobiales bacterium]